MELWKPLERDTLFSPLTPASILERKPQESLFLSPVELKKQKEKEETKGLDLKGQGGESGEEKEKEIKEKNLKPCFVSKLGLQNVNQLFLPKFYLTFETNKNDRATIVETSKMLRQIICESLKIPEDDFRFVATPQRPESLKELGQKEAERSYIQDLYKFLIVYDMQYTLKIKFEVNYFTLYWDNPQKQNTFLSLVEKDLQTALQLLQNPEYDLAEIEITKPDFLKKSVNVITLFPEKKLDSSTQHQPTSVSDAGIFQFEVRMQGSSQKFLKTRKILTSWSQCEIPLVVQLAIDNLSENGSEVENWDFYLKIPELVNKTFHVDFELKRILNPKLEEPSNPPRFKIPLTSGTLSSFSYSAPVSSPSSSSSQEAQTMPPPPPEDAPPPPPPIAPTPAPPLAPSSSSQTSSQTSTQSQPQQQKQQQSQGLDPGDIVRRQAEMKRRNPNPNLSNLGSVAAPSPDSALLSSIRQGTNLQPPPMPSCPASTIPSPSPEEMFLGLFIKANAMVRFQLDKPPVVKKRTKEEKDRFQENAEIKKDMAITMNRIPGIAQSTTYWLGFDANFPSRQAIFFVEGMEKFNSFSCTRKNEESPFPSYSLRIEATLKKVVINMQIKPMAECDTKEESKCVDATGNTLCFHKIFCDGARTVASAGIGTGGGSSGRPVVQGQGQGQATASSISTATSATREWWE